MLVLETRAEVREWVADRRQEGLRIGLVPTMGALHAGHTSLVEAVRPVADQIVLSIFVNPLQFGPGEDFDRYPRALQGDLDAARSAGVAAVFAPPVTEMYPDGEPWVAVVPERGADQLCGASRPGHFRGVLTVVAKLFGIVTPDVAVFGQKDYQQLTLIRRMVEDLELGIEIITGATVREDGGLALSSRNRYLSEDERRQALSLSAALRGCRALFAGGERDPARYLERMRETLDPAAILEYAEVVDPRSLSPLESVVDGSVCAIAAHIGATRLIDNTILGSTSSL